MAARISSAPAHANALAALGCSDLQNRTGFLERLCLQNDLPFRTPGGVARAFNGCHATLPNY
jgi:hypothetical protein